jgi:hypothetical protein
MDIPTQWELMCILKEEMSIGDSLARYSESKDEAKR